MLVDSEYTGAGIVRPHSRNGVWSSSEVTLRILTRTPWAPPEQSVFSFGFKVKLWKVNLIRPLGTLMVHIHMLDEGKFPGKLGLDTTPLDDPLRVTPPAAQATRKTCQVIATVLQDCSYFIILMVVGEQTL